MTGQISLLVGTYTQPILQGTGAVVQGRGEGVYGVSFDGATGRFGPPTVVARTPNPSYLCLSTGGEILYAVNELKDYDQRPQGSVSAFRLIGRHTELIGVQPTSGTDPCHVGLSPDSRLALVANFMSGSLAVFELAGDGGLAPRQFFQYHGQGPDPQRQAGPHAHGSAFGLDGRFVYVPDLGLDQIHIYSYDRRQGRLLEQGDAITRPGSGPRACVLHPAGEWLYCINELDCTVDSFAVASDGALSLVDSVTSLAGASTRGASGAALRITPDGRWLYASNRGDDSVAHFAVEADGHVTPCGKIPCGGQIPRDFTIDPDGRYLIVANQASDNLVAFSIGQDGGLTQIATVEVPTPVCVICRPGSNPGHCPL